MKAPRSILVLIALLSVCSARYSFGGFGLKSAPDAYTVDTGAGLVFQVRRTDNGKSTQSAGDLMSLVFNGVEYQNQARGSHINSGFDYLYSGISAVSVHAEKVGRDSIKVTVTAGDLTHYYLARRGSPVIYMATHFTTEPSTLNLCRYIVRIPEGLLPNGPEPSDIRHHALETLFQYAAQGLVSYRRNRRQHRNLDDSQQSRGRFRRAARPHFPSSALQKIRAA